MSHQYKKVPIRKFPKIQQNELNSGETKFWKQFKFPIIYQHFAGVSHVAFSPAEPHQFAVTSSSRVHIYDPATNNLVKTVSRFQDVAYSGSFKSDGKLLVAGGEEGLAHVFDLGSRAVLRTFKGHKGPVHVAKYSPNNVNVVTGGDDKILACWDVPTQQMVLKLTGHKDYIRTAAHSSTSPDIWVTGGYDHNIMLWDFRTQKATMCLDHGAPVESILMFPSNSLVVSAGGNYIKIWDIIGGNAIHTLSNHQKTITSLCFDGTGQRLLSGSLDHQVKIYNVSDYEVVHSVKYPSPILSLGVSPDNTHLVVGMSDGLLSIRHRVPKLNETFREKKINEKISTGNFRNFYSQKFDRDNFMVRSTKKPSLQRYDVFLKKFNYKNAFDAALETKQSPLIYSMIEELIRRDGLTIALSGRDDVTLEPVISFLHSNITNPRYTSLLIDVANTVLDLYSSVIGQSVLIDELLMKLQMKIAKEIQFQKELLNIAGSIDMMLTASLGKPQISN